MIFSAGDSLVNFGISGILDKVTVRIFGEVLGIFYIKLSVLPPAPRQCTPIPVIDPSLLKSHSPSRRLMMPVLV